MPEPLASDAEDYLRRLRGCLSTLEANERDEIVAEVRAHFAERLAQGHANVVTKFDPPETYAGSFIEESSLSRAVARGSSLALGKALLLGLQRGAETLLVVVPLVLVQVSAFVLLVLGVLKPFFFENIGVYVRGGAFTLGFVSDPRRAGRAARVVGGAAVHRAERDPPLAVQSSDEPPRPRTPRAGAPGEDSDLSGAFFWRRPRNARGPVRHRAPPRAQGRRRERLPSLALRILRSAPSRLAIELAAAVGVLTAASWLVSIIPHPKGTFLLLYAPIAVPASIGVYVALVRLLERRRVTELARGGALRELGLGLLLGAGLFSKTIGIIAASGG